MILSGHVKTIRLLRLKGCQWAGPTPSLSPFCLNWPDPKPDTPVSLLQTSTDIPKTETTAPTLPPTPTPLVIATTVTIGRNVTILEVGGKWMGLKGKALGSGGGR